MQALAPEILIQIFSFLPPSDLLKGVQGVCRHFHVQSSHNVIWQPLYSQTFLAHVKQHSGANQQNNFTVNQSLQSRIPLIYKHFYSQQINELRSQHANNNDNNQHLFQLQENFCTAKYAYLYKSILERNWKQPIRTRNADNDANNNSMVESQRHQEQQLNVIASQNSAVSKQRPLYSTRVAEFSTGKKYGVYTMKMERLNGTPAIDQEECMDLYLCTDGNFIEKRRIFISSNFQNNNDDNEKQQEQNKENNAIVPTKQLKTKTIFKAQSANALMCIDVNTRLLQGHFVAAGISQE